MLFALVLDDTCGNVGDFSRHVMARVKDLNSILNLKMILTKEGFGETKLYYLGGLWVMIELNNVETQKELLHHTGAKSWIQELQAATSDFVSNERIVWVDIEGIPLSVWSHATFSRNGKKWGDVIDIEESTGSSFARKRLCIKTCLADNILESFIVIFKGKRYSVRAKELFTWTPCFLEYKDTEYSDDEESIRGVNDKPAESPLDEDVLTGESDVEGVSDTIFGDVSPSSISNNECINKEQEAAQQNSDDPFGFYELLKKPPNTTVPESDPSLSHPTGFTPDVSQQEKQNDDVVHVREDCYVSPIQNENSQVARSKAMNTRIGESSCEFSTSVHSRKSLNGGSILDVLDGIIKVGQSMGYDMERCSKDTECIIGFQGDSIFKKDGVSVSDNFIALYGTWLPTNTKILIVVIYAPQSAVLKRTLWEYISILINRWNGETLILGDFNEVRSEDECFGSIFSPSSARSVKDIRLVLDDLFLPSSNEAIRWAKYVSIKVNVFAWRARLDRLPTRDNLAKRGVIMDSSLCLICGLFPENAQHLFFGCDMARSIALRICHWWNLNWTEISSFAEWNSWFASIRLSAKLKMLLEGVFLTFWWFIWSFRNRGVGVVTSATALPGVGQHLQRHPPSFNSETSQSLTQPQQVDSPKKDGHKKTKSKRGKNVKDEPVAVGRWLPVEEELLATCYVAVSEDNNVGRSQKNETFWYRVLNEFNSKNFQKRTKDMLTSKWHTLNANCQKFNAAYKWAKRLGKSGENDVDVLKRTQSIYRDEHKGVAYCQEDAWAILKFHPKWDAPEQVDLTGDELRPKREAAERAFEIQAEKDRTLMRLDELRFLATSTKDLDYVDAYWIKKQKRLIRNKMKNDLGAEDDEDEDE
nr:hypothetical protein [Tanacetum cinerariifolium]